MSVRSLDLQLAVDRAISFYINFPLLSGSPFTCDAVDLKSASVRSLDLQLAVDRATSFYIHSEAVGQALNANVDVYCKLCVYVPGFIIVMYDSVKMYCG